MNVQLSYLAHSTFSLVHSGPNLHDINDILSESSDELAEASKYVGVNINPTNATASLIGDNIPSAPQKRFAHFGIGQQFLTSSRKRIASLNQNIALVGDL